MKQIFLATFLVITGYAKEVADQFPKMKVGLWKTVMTEGKKVSKSSICIDKNTKMNLMQGSREMLGTFCKFSEKWVNKSYVTAADCNIMGMKMKTVNTSTGNFENEVDTLIKITRGNGKANTATLTKSRFKGPCPKNMKPGDLIYDNNGKEQKLNTVDMMKDIKNFNFDKLKNLK